MSDAREVFENLFSVNVNGHTEGKEVGGRKLTYLSWTYAWAELLKRYPDAEYKIYRNADGLPYFFDSQTGYMVFTCVTIEGKSKEMWLPVMDSNNRAMKAERYTVKTKYKEITVEPATMFDVNKTIMRCLVKNLAMFGLGLYIYAGEDLPESEEKQETPAQNDAMEEAKARTELLKLINTNGLNVESICKKYGVEKLGDMDATKAKACISWIRKKLEEKK